MTHSQNSEAAKGKPRSVQKIPFEEAMLKYGTDKPDLRNPLEICDLTEFFSDVDFKPFKGKPVRGIVAPGCGKRARASLKSSSNMLSR